jgi:IMP dehydrogenase/GMP reductase
MFTQLWTVKMSDFQRGLAVAILTTPLTIIYDTVTATPMVLTFDWKRILGAALAGGIGYLLKNLFTGQQGSMLTNK